MRKKTILVVLSIVLAFALFLMACGGRKSEGEPGTEDKTSEQPTEGGEEPKETEDPGKEAAIPDFEDIEFPDELPVKPPMAEEGWYGYDDLSEKYTVTILTHHYGQPALPPEEDPICQWLNNQFNLDLRLEAVNMSDLETTISTRFAGGDPPDIFYAPKKEIAFELSNQGLLVDARQIYPLMPQTCKFVTKNMIAWSTNPSNGEIPFITKYGIQDGVWGFAIRQDWLDKFGMEPPTNKDELMRFAKACVDEDPNGNGEKDTYFMTGAGGGQSFGMLGGFNTMFGNPAPHVENGQLSHPMFNGVQEKFIAFLNELNNAGVLAPDWYTIEWEQAKAYTHGDKLGMVWYPAGALLAEYTNAKNKTLESVDVWTYWKEPPIEGGKYPATGNPGYTWCFTKQGFTDEGKLKRVAHMLDTMVIGGENFFHTIQGGTNEVFEAMGIKVETPRECVYNDDGTFYIYNEDGFPWRQEDGYSPIGIWQHFGLSVIWQRNAPKGATEFDKKHNETANRLNDIFLSYHSWPNDSLKIDVAFNEIAPNLSDFEKA